MMPELKQVDTYWVNNNPALTHYFHALSTLFNKGESFFMHSVTSYLQTNPEFKQQIIKFCKEEREHTLMHDKLNAMFPNKTLLQKLEKRTGTIINLGTKFLSRNQKLAATAALEHITCSLATHLLERKDIQDLMKSDAKLAWIAHSIDETSPSHRTLAYNLYKEVSNNTLQRHIIMILATAILTVVIMEYWTEIMLDDSFKGLPQALYLLFIKNGGFIPNILPQYLEWFSTNYTP